MNKFDKVKQRSLTYPTRGQLAGSYFLGHLYDMEDSLVERFEGLEMTLVEIELRGLIEQVEEFRADAQYSYSNMPKRLNVPGKEKSTFLLLRDRIKALGEWVSKLQRIHEEMWDEDEEAVIRKIIEARCGL